MDISTFMWSVIASIVAAVIIGAPVTYKIVTRNKIKSRDNINQTGSNNTAFQNSTITNNYSNAKDSSKEENKNV